MWLCAGGDIALRCLRKGTIEEEEVLDVRVKIVMMWWVCCVCALRAI